MEAVNSSHGDNDRCVKTKGYIRSPNIVVNGFGNPYPHEVLTAPTVPPFSECHCHRYTPGRRVRVYQSFVLISRGLVFNRIIVLLLEEAFPGTYPEWCSEVENPLIAFSTSSGK